MHRAPDRNARVLDAPSRGGLSCRTPVRRPFAPRLLGACILGVALAWTVSSVTVRAAEDSRMDTLARLVRDDSPRVRVEALRALAKIPTVRSAELALGVLDLPMDPTLDYALWLTINDLAEPWIEAVRSGTWKPDGREKQLEFALKALKPDQVSRVLGSVLGARPLPRDGRGPWIEVLGSAGSAQDLRRMWDQAVAGGFDSDATLRSLKALGEAVRLRKVRPTGALDGLATFYDNPDSAVRTESFRLAGFWREIGGAVPALLDRVAGMGEARAAERAVAMEALRQIGGDGVTDRLNAWVRPDQDAGLRRAAAASLAALDGLKGFPAAVSAAESLTDEAAALEFWRGILGIRGSAGPLRDALSGRRLPEAAARAGMRVAREGGRDEIELVTAFATAGGLATDTQKLTDELMKELAGRVVAKGDPRRGERIYRRTDLACTTCHSVGGAGGKVGPDMTSIGASAPVDYLVESLMLPNAKIKEGYHSLVLETKDGEEVTGTVARETQDEIVLRNATGQEVPVAKASIQRREIGRLSLMPSGLLEPLGEQDRLDLLAFLSQLGKPGEFDASQGGVARVWYFGNVVHTDQQNNQTDWIWTTPLTAKRWVPVTTLVRGDISSDLMETATRAQAWTGKLSVVAATEIRQAVAGPIRLKLNTADAEIWVDGKSWGRGPEVSGEIGAGLHRVIVSLDPRRLPESLRLEGPGVAFVLN
ncbi:MAG: hypothetical protein AB7O66_05505 [Limisphaerales bacterium]